MADQELKDWCSDVYITDTMGAGWCVRIDGSSITDEVGQYNCKPCHSFCIATGLKRKEEAEAFALNWMQEQAAKFAAPSQPVAGQPSDEQIEVLHDEIFGNCGFLPEQYKQFAQGVIALTTANAGKDAR